MLLRFDGGDAICRVQRISVASFGMPGETVKVKVKAANTGFSNGRDVKPELLIAGQKEEVDSVTYPVWLAGEEKEVEYEYTVPKDADLSGEVDIVDATTIQRHDAHFLTLVGTALQLADVDKDEEVTIIDATWIQRWELDMKAPEGIGKPI